MHTKFWSQSLKERDHSEDLDIEGDNTRTNLREIGLEGVDSIHTARDRDQWRAFRRTRHR
jgi:hypothetical protein